MKIAIGLFGLLRNTNIENSLNNLKKIINDSSNLEIDVYICIPNLLNELDTEPIDINIFKNFNANVKLYDYSVRNMLLINKQLNYPIKINNFYPYRILSFFYGIHNLITYINETNDYDVYIISRFDHIEHLTIQFNLLNTIDIENNCYILRQHDARCGYTYAEDRGFIVSKKHLNIISDIYIKIVNKEYNLHSEIVPEKILLNNLANNNIVCLIGSACSDPCPSINGVKCVLEDCLYRYEGVTVYQNKFNDELYQKINCIYNSI